MATRFEDLLAQYASAGANANETTDPSYDAYTAAVGRNTQAGLDSAGMIEKDIRTLDPAALYLKYGAEADTLIARQAVADRQLQRDQTQGRTLGEAISDFTGSTINAAANSLIGIGALGTGLVDPETGVAISRGLNTITRDNQNNQSAGMKAQRSINTALQRLSQRDNAKVASQRDAEDKNGFITGLERIGRDVVDTLSNAGETGSGMVADTIAQGLGSLLPAAKVANVFRAAGAGTALSGELAAGTLEAGGAFQSGATDSYDKLIAQGYSPEEASVRANQDALLAAAIQGPTAALTTRAAGLGEFEANPFRSGSLNGAIGNVVKEGVEEGIQSASGQFAQNFAQSFRTDPNIDLSEGVGEQVALGALGGIGSAGITQAPRIALQTAVETAKLPFKALKEGLTYRANQLDARNQKVQDDLLNGLFDQADAAASEVQAEIDGLDATPEQKSTYAQKFSDLISKVPAAKDMIAKAQEFLNAQDIPSKIQAIAGVISAKNASEATQEEATPEGLEKTAYQSIKDVVSNAAQSESVQKATEQAKKMFTEVGARLNTAFDNALRKAPTEGFEDVQNNLPTMEAMATTNPEQVSVKTIDDILYHDEQQNITLTPIQRATFRAARALAVSAQTGSELASRFGLEDAERVSREVLTELPTEGKKLSVNGHLAGIMAAYNAGNADLAAQLLGDLASFGKHLSNKVTAFNDALLGGNTSDKNPVRGVSVHVGDGKFRPIGEVYFQPRAAGSVKLAQNIAVQASVVSNVVNNLSNDLGLNIAHLPTPTLDASLEGDAAVVAKEYRTGQRKVPSTEVVSAEPKVEATAPVEEPSTTVEPVSEEVTTSVQNEKTSEPVETVEETPKAEPEVVAEPTPEAEAAPEKIRVGGERNRVSKAFKEAKSEKTRLTKEGSPFQQVKDILKSGTAFREALGKDLKKSFTDDVAKAYVGHLAIGEDILSTMNDRLQKFLKDKLGRGRTLEQSIDTLEGGALNAVLDNGDGTYSYDPQIVEPAVLAGLQYLNSMGSRSAPMSNEDIRSMLGMDEDANVTETLANQINNGLSALDMVRSLAQKIGQYIGMSTNPNAPANYAESVLEGLAKEFLESVTTKYNKDGSVKEQGLIDVTKVDTSAVSSIPFINRYRKFNIEGPMDKFPTAIETAVLLVPEQVNYIDEVPTEVEMTQLRSDVPITEQQVSAIKKEQATPHFLNNAFITRLQNMGDEAMLELFAGGDTSKPMNKNHKASLEGRNLTFKMAMESIRKLVAEADSNDQTPIYYRYAYTVANRMQMLGANNPQSNKLMREAVLPTWDTIDLTDPEVMHRYSLGLAQALGVKVHTLSSDAMLKSLSETLEALPQTIDLLSDEDHKFSPTDIQIIKNEFNALGEKITPVAIHVLMDYARMLESDDVSAYRTAIYFEADGVTNGVINAMNLFTSGDFKPEWVSNVERGGYFIGDGPKSLAALRARNADAKRDLYKVAGDNTQVNVSDNLQRYKGTSVGDQIGHVLKFLDMFTSGIDYDAETRTIAIDRGATKNPLTITIYGSGAKGIAGNLLDAGMDTLYEMMSTAAQRKADDSSLTTGQAIFGGDKDTAAKKLADLEAMFGALVGSRLGSNEGSLYVSKPQAVSIDFSNFEDFGISGEAYNRMRTNIQHGFVTSLVEGITQTVGSDLIDTMNLIRNQTNIWSIVGQFKYLNAYEKALSAKRAANPEMNSYELLSPAENDAILKSIAADLPSFSTGTQNFQFGGSQRFALPFMTSKNGNALNLEFSRSLTDGFQTDAVGRMPGRSGVSGQPLMTIGNGDGQAVQNIIENPETPAKRLQIFDGIHSTANELTQMGLVANQGVADSWKQNPLKALAKAYEQFVNQVDLSDLTDDQRRVLGNLLGTQSESDPVFRGRQDELDTFIAEAEKAGFGIPTTESIKTGLEILVAEGNDRARGIDDRLAVLAQVAKSVDQMAGASNPYTTDGIIISGTPAEKASQLNALMTQNIAGEVVEPEQKTTITEAPVQTLNKLTDKMIQNATQDRQTRAMLRELLRSGALENVSVNIGSRGDLIALARTMGISIPAGRTQFNGFTAGNQVFVVDGNPETLLHELIHVATYKTLQDYYAGNIVHDNVKPAVERLEGLMAEFRAADLSGSQNQNALDEIERQEAAGNKAAALNEFMAWSLSNQEISEQLKAEKAPKWLRLARNAVRELKHLLWGSKRSAAVKDNLFSNIRFNTSIIARSGNVARELNDTLLFHDSSFGNNPRIETLLGRIKTKVADHIGNDRYEAAMRQNRAEASLAHGARMAIAASKVGFTFTQQEMVAFTHMVGILSTAADLDPNALSRMQELYQHVMGELKWDSFVTDPNVVDQNDEAMALDKYNFLMGRYTSAKDKFDRTSILPAFIALAQTNEQFRELLKNTKMPKGKYAGWNTVDNIVDNIGDMAMDALGVAMSGQGITPRNVQKAMDNLVADMLETNAQAEFYIEKFTNPVGGAIDRANAKVIEAFDVLGKWSQKNVNNNKDAGIFRRNLSEAINLVAGLLHEETGHQTSMNLMEEANKSELLPTFFYDLLNDIIGRTEQNKDVYDLIKKARQWISGVRQQYIEHFPQIVNGKFKATLTESQQEQLHRGIAQTDMASLMETLTYEQVAPLLQSDSKRDMKIKSLKDTIKNLSPDNANLIIEKSEQLADYMVTKTTGSNLLRNADAIANLLGENVKEVNSSPQMVTAIDQLISLLAFSNQSTPVREAISSLVQREPEGMKFMLGAMKGIRAVDTRKAYGNGRFNSYKGYMAASPIDGVSLVVAHDSDAKNLLEKSYVRIGKLEGSDRDPTAKNRSYWYAPISGRAAFAQGILQNVQQTVGGVDHKTGFTQGLTGGVIIDPSLVEAIGKSKAKESKGTALLPVYDQNGVVIAYERQVAPSMTAKLKPDFDMAKMMGVRAGRQVEEAYAMRTNIALIDRLADMYNKATDKSGFVNLSTSTDPVHQDAMSIMSYEVRQYIEGRFPKGFMVRKDMINDAIGYRNASVGDAWTGTSRWSPQTQQAVKQILKNMFGNKAYAYATKAEKFLQSNIVQDIRTMIVIRSIVVPMANAASNVYQLISRGVPIGNVTRGIPKKIAELESWQKTRLRMMEARAELLALTDERERQRLVAEIKSIEDSHKRLSIYPLLQAGEFSAISDAGSREDVLLSEGKLSDYLEALVDKLPEGVKTAGKYAIISKDTALFRGLQKSVDYGDFVAKAILYDDLVKRQGKTKAQALGQITEEFVNYDRLPGRDRQYLESIGLLWFWNFKVRSAKVAMSMVRNNPVHALIAANLPTPINGIGLPLEDNLWASLFDGRALNSIGFGMAFRGPGLLPLGNILS